MPGSVCMPAWCCCCDGRHILRGAQKRTAEIDHYSAATEVCLCRSINMQRASSHTEEPTWGKSETPRATRQTSIHLNNVEFSICCTKWHKGICIEIIPRVSACREREREPLLGGLVHKQNLLNLWETCRCEWTRGK